MYRIFGEIGRNGKARSVISKREKDERPLNSFDKGKLIEFLYTE